MICLKDKEIYLKNISEINRKVVKSIYVGEEVKQAILDYKLYLEITRKIKDVSNIQYLFDKYKGGDFCCDLEAYKTIFGNFEE